MMISYWKKTKEIYVDDGLSIVMTWRNSGRMSHPENLLDQGVGLITKAVQNVRRLSQTGKADLYMLQWAIITVELWVRQFIDGKWVTSGE